MPANVRLAPSTWTVTVGPAGRSSTIGVVPTVTTSLTAALVVLIATVMSPPLKVMPGSANAKPLTLIVPATPPLRMISAPVASLMSTNAPSVSRLVFGSLLTTPIFTRPGAASTVKLPSSCWPATLSLTSVPVNSTLPAAVSMSALRSPVKVTPGIDVVTAPVKWAVAPVSSSLRLPVSPLIVTRPPPSETAPLAMSNSMSPPFLTSERSPLSVWPATLSVPPLTASLRYFVAPVVSICSASVPASETPGTVRATAPLICPAMPLLATVRSPLPLLRLATVPNARLTLLAAMLTPSALRVNARSALRLWPPKEKPAPSPRRGSTWGRRRERRWRASGR